MSILKRAADLAYTFRFLKLLVTPFEDTKAFKLGIIDENGDRNRDVKISTSEHKSAYTAFNKLVFNIKKLLAKVPGGKSSLASYAAALYLIREKYDLKDNQLKKIVEKSGHEVLEFINESNDWFILENQQFSPGIYRIKYNKMVNSTCEELVKAKDQIRIEESCFPAGNVFGLNVYEGIHVLTKQKIYLTAEEVTK